MSFTKKAGSVETFEADNLDDCLDGIMDILEDQNVPDDASGPTVTIILQNSIINGKDRTFKGTLFIGTTKEDILKNLTEKFL